MSKARLIRLKSYEALPQDLRNAVALHLLHGISGEQACAYVGRNNGQRDWNRERVQKVLTDYRAGADPGDVASAAELAELVAELDRRATASANPKFIAPQPPAVAPGWPQSASNTVQSTSAPPETPQPLPAHEIPSNLDGRCPKCRLVLCGCARGEKPPAAAPNLAARAAPAHSDVPMSELFEWAGQPVQGAGGRSSVDIWREQAQAEQAERAALIRQIEEGQERRRQQNDDQLSNVWRPR